MIRKIVLLGILTLMLVLTCGTFAYGFLNKSNSLLLYEKPDFATVEASSDKPVYKVFGSYIGEVGQGELFIVTPHPNWNGDMVCDVSIANPANLVAAYRALSFEIQIWDATDIPVGSTEYLSLRNNIVSINIDQSVAPYSVRIVGGYYISNRAGWGEWVDGDEEPVFYCQVNQR